MSSNLIRKHKRDSQNFKTKGTKPRTMWTLTKNTYHTLSLGKSEKKKDIPIGETRRYDLDSI